MNRPPKSNHKRGARVVPEISLSSKVTSGSNPIWGDDEPLLLADAASFTRMPLPTFKQKIYAREIESVKVGRRRMVQPSAVRTYLQKHKRPAL